MHKCQQILMARSKTCTHMKYKKQIFLKLMLSCIICKKERRASSSQAQERKAQINSPTHFLNSLSFPLPPSAKTNRQVELDGDDVDEYFLVCQSV